MRILKPVVLLAALAGAFALPSSASAALLVPEVEGCEQSAADRVFLPWVDVAKYVEAPDGTLESTQLWDLSGGAASVNGNEPYYVAGDESHSRSLKLPPGSGAVTAPMCVGLEHPTLRFFSRSSGGGLLPSALAVSVLYQSNLGILEELPIGVALPTGSWQPTLPMMVLANLLPLLSGDKTTVQFRFTPIGAATWYIDDVFVDPWRGN